MSRGSVIFPVIAMPRSSCSLDTKEYWNPLSRVITDHPESKSIGNAGWLRRRTLVVSATSIHYIGKEANELETAMVLGVSGEEYVDYTDYGRRIAQMSRDEARAKGISRQRQWYWRKKSDTE